jgi:signal transduction histidine kinase
MVVVALLLSAFSITIYQNYAYFRKTEFNERLTERCVNLAGLVVNGDTPLYAFNKVFEDNAFRPLSGQRISVYNSEGLNLSKGIIKEVNGIDRTTLNYIWQNKRWLKTEGDTVTIGLVTDIASQKYIVIGSALDSVGKKKMYFLKQVIIISFLISIILIAIIGWLFATQALRPIKNVVDQAKLITAQNLHSRLPERKNNDEIAQLTKTFNQMLDRLEASFVMQKNFVSNASHEFRTPLTAINTQIEVMLNQDRSPSEYVQTLRSIKEDVDGFMHLLASLSELAKTDIEQIRFNPERVPVIEILAESRAELLRNKPHYRIDFHIESLPENEEHNYVKGNPTLLKSAIKNLVENACKFSPELRCEIKITFKDGIEIIIIDEGIGISESELAFIFEPFFRANDARSINGHGIGLSLVKKIIEMHGGKVWAESKLSRGTKMFVHLPYSQ